MPVAMEKVKWNADGNDHTRHILGRVVPAISRSARAIRHATNTSAGAVAKPGMAVATGAKNSVKQEQHGHRHSGQPGASAGLNASGTLDVAGRRARPEHRADDRTAAVCQQRLTQPRHGAIGSHQTRALRRGDQRPGIVETHPPGRTSITTVVTPSDNAPRISSCIKVWRRSDGGADTTPCSSVSPSGMPSTAVTRMPIRMAPRRPRADSPAMIRNPRHASIVGVLSQGRQVQPASLDCRATTPISCKPINPRNSPIPRQCPTSAT